MLDKEIKSEIIKKYSENENDTGSSGVQIGLLSKRIETISGHLKLFPKDKHSELGLVKLVGKRRSLLNYLQRKDKARFDFMQKEIKRK
ncbi:30S ribosomal protein S15 [Candidatus Babeliales bacterium]|nr:30S ribosomal protein S15 [Candidatus Babeliales bacterium]MCF7899463.1 30S ribosomal protein S15 [Candidatus Babeliales bacterium]